MGDTKWLDGFELIQEKPKKDLLLALYTVSRNSVYCINMIEWRLFIYLINSKFIWSEKNKKRATKTYRKIMK